MGSRTAWEIRTDAEGPSIYLYSHWGGESKWSDTVDALRAAEPRWSDSTYGARIFISQIIGNQWDSETGFGITAGERGSMPFEESYFPIFIDFRSRTVIAGDRFYDFSEFLTTEDVSAELMAGAWA